MIVEYPSGGCPECGAGDGMINVRADHYFVCHLHRVYWSAGSNIYPDWRKESDATWRANRAVINAYRRVRPVLPGEESPNPARSRVVHIETWRMYRESAVLDREARKLGYRDADDPRLIEDCAEHDMRLADEEARRHGYADFNAWDAAGRPERDPAA